MIESVLVGVLSFSTLFFLLLYMIQIKKNRAILANTIRLLLMQDSMNGENKTDKEKADEAFLKFVSDSRDWAYSYIDSVQEEINSFITIVGPDIEYLEAYKPPIISEEATNRLFVGYKKIKALLPDDYGKIDT
jgi:hypothetical protein